MSMESNDHDILIEMKTLLKGVIDDFRAYRQESHKSISALEAKYSELEKNKLSVVDYSKQNADDKVRITRLERGYWMAVGVIALIQFLAPVIMSKFI